MNNNAQRSTAILKGDIAAIIRAIHETNASLRLVAANDFAGFVGLSRTEQRHALSAALTLSTIAVELAETLHQSINPDKG